MPKRIIQEWDGASSVVQPKELPSGDICITYQCGSFFHCTRKYLDSISQQSKRCSQQSKLDVTTTPADTRIP